MNLEQIIKDSEEHGYVAIAWDESTGYQFLPANVDVIAQHIEWRRQNTMCYDYEIMRPSEASKRKNLAAEILLESAGTLPWYFSPPVVGVPWRHAPTQASK